MKDRSRIIKHYVAATITGCISVANAQEAAESAPPELQEVVVTGSRIRGVAPVGSDVIALGRAEITETTSLSVADILKELPQVVGVGITEGTYAVTTGGGSNNLTRGTAVNLRGLGPSATLVLFDGYRITESGVAATYVDTSVFPTIALERFEVIADGASAIYGSDAVGGVVNLILRKDFDGAESDVRYVTADGYSRWQLSQLIGHTWNSGSLVAAYEFTDNSMLNSDERDWYRQDQTNRGGADYRVSTCDPGTLVVGGVSYALPGTDAPTADDLVPGTTNWCDMGFASIIPEQRRHNATLRFEQDLGDRVTLSATGFYSRRDFLANFVDQGSNLASTQRLTVPSSNAYFLAPAGTNPTSAIVQYSFFPERGPVIADGESTTYGAFTTLGVELPASWRMEVSGAYSDNDAHVFSRNINTAALNAALASSDPNTALDAFGNRTNPQVLRDIYSGVFVPLGKNRLQTAAARFDGPLFALPGGMVRAALGVEYLESKIMRGNLRGPESDPTRQVYGGRRDVNSAYAEMVVPIVGSANAVSGIQRLDLSVAGRYDRYSDFGSTSNPKIGLTWEPLQNLEVRASYGTSFRAPLLTEKIVNDPRVQVVDAVDPLSPVGRARGLSIRGNPDELGAEEAKTWSLGLQFTPDALPGFNVNVNYFNVEYDGQVFAVEGTEALLQENIFADLIIRNPTQEQIQQVLNMGLRVQGADPTNVDFIVDSRAYNRGRTEQSGIDLQMAYDWSVEGVGDFRASVIGMYLDKYDYQTTPLAPQVDRLNTIINPLQLRGRAGLGWSRDAWNARLSVNYANSYDNNQVDPVEKIDAWTTVDLHLGYRFQDNGSWMDGFSLSLDVSNIADEDPPFVNVAAGYDPQHANALGRTIALGLTKQW